jgi:hypothetical protein
MGEGKGQKQLIQCTPATWKSWKGNKHHQQYGYMVIIDIAVTLMGPELSAIIMGYENRSPSTKRNNAIIS